MDTRPGTELSAARGRHGRDELPTSERRTPPSGVPHARCAERPSSGCGSRPSMPDPRYPATPTSRASGCGAITSDAVGHTRSCNGCGRPRVELLLAGQAHAEFTAYPETRIVSCGYFCGFSMASYSVSRLSTLMLTWSLRLRLGVKKSDKVLGPAREGHVPGRT